MVRPLPLAQHTLYADLLEQGSDDLFDPNLPENGSILIRGNRPGGPADHAYYQGYRPAAGDDSRGQRYASYLGRADEPDVAARITRFRRVKAVRAERTTAVRALIGAGMPRPDRMTGRVIEGLARAGILSDDAVLIGEAASRTYDGVLGVRLSKPRNTTGRGQPVVEIATWNGRRSADILAALSAVDPSFGPEPETTSSYSSSSGVRVAVTSLDRADDATSNRIGYLIATSVRAVVLHGPGIPVTVPSPERLAVYALMERAAEAALLLEALAIAGRQHVLVGALETAMGSRLLSNALLVEGLNQLPPDLAEQIEALI